MNNYQTVELYVEMSRKSVLKFYESFNQFLPKVKV